MNTVLRGVGGNLLWWGAKGGGGFGMKSSKKGLEKLKRFDFPTEALCFSNVATTLMIIPASLNYSLQENRAGPSNIGNVISQILLCKTIAPDFNQEEICSIAKDSQELTRIVHEMQEFLPQQEINAERPAALTGEDATNKWTKKRRRSSIYKNVGSFCCLCRPNYL
ncbi:hypothetical protein LSTR_LSTR008846 [Laodelphax striatellus]|uniref:Uncharacterized protein n=1 Tax=Laodelphax striatellus TaxID=195883 RepID=A0A482WTL1_LAOST|nr:hypothetical protein LSTR_LSTR008846 [Laodelphax striatellus]